MCRRCQTIREIGESRFSGMCLDSTGNTRQGRQEVHKLMPSKIMDLGDCCHHIHNTIKDINKLEEFKTVSNPHTRNQFYGPTDSTTLI
jgi:hypothetical protein